nr:FAD-dependent oxidoreductase [Candidatus Burkholderia verschuerenii]
MSESTLPTPSPDLLALHGLLARWRHARTFTFVDTRFDGARFLDMWHAWRSDDARYDRLHVIAVGTLRDLDAPPADADLARVWPMRVPGVHRLEFDAGRVTLTLAIGDRDDTGNMLSKLWARADAFHLDASTLTDARRLAKSLARIAGDGTTVSATADANLRDALRASGFECDEASDASNATLSARFAPRWRVRRHEPPLAIDAANRGDTRKAIVVGAGLAGCAMTSRLASRGWRVTLIDRHAQPARDASGNPAGVFHPIV